MMFASSLLILTWAWLVGLPHAWFHVLALHEFTRTAQCSRVEDGAAIQESCKLMTELCIGLWTLFLAGFTCVVMLSTGLGLLSRYLSHGRNFLKTERAQDRLLYSTRTFYAAAVCAMIYILSFTCLLRFNKEFQPGKASTVATLVNVAFTLVLTFLSHHHFTALFGGKQAQKESDDSDDSEGKEVPYGSMAYDPSAPASAYPDLTAVPQPIHRDLTAVPQPVLRNVEQQGQDQWYQNQGAPRSQY